MFPSALQKQLDQEAKKRSESALQSLTTYADTRGVGLKLLASMGFGGEGTGLGRNEQVQATTMHQWPHRHIGKHGMHCTRLTTGLRVREGRGPFVVKACDSA